MNKLFEKLQKLQIKIDKLVDSRFVGEYRSAFKGSGLEFDEIREYQFGDEIRTINWNVTAKSADKVFVKLFKEERELSIFVLFDISGSEYFGKTEQSKINIGTELAAIFIFSAMKNNDKFGLISYSDQIEKVFPLSKGRKKALSIISYLLQQTPKSRGTNLLNALEYFHKIQRKRSVLFIISDFLDKSPFFDKIKFLKKKHDITLLRLFHPDELLPNVFGILPLIESENQKKVWLQSSIFKKNNSLHLHFNQLDLQLRKFSFHEKIDYLTITTTEDYVPILENYFKGHHKLKH
jgi:uncharacterized protein (DUF58 family)